MGYEKQEWIDHIEDITTGEILQEGTLYCARLMNHMEDGIFNAHSRVTNIVDRMKYKTKFYISSYWSEVIDNNGNYTMYDENKVNNDIEIWKNHNVDGVTIIIHIGLNTSTNKLFIGADLDKVSTYMDKCINAGIPIYAVKIHKQKMTSSQISAVSDFNDQWKALLIEIATKFAIKTTRVFCFNEFSQIYSNADNNNFVISCLTAVKNIGCLVGISTQSYEEMYTLDDDIKGTLDILGINHYRYISSKGSKTTYEDSLKSWRNSTVLKVMQHLKSEYPNKEVIMSESGVQDFWEALAKPEYFSWNNPTSANGKAQAIYLYGLLETTNEDFIDGVCWWYNFAYKDKETSKLMKQYLGGDDND